MCDVDDNLEALIEFKAAKAVKAVQEREGPYTVDLAAYFSNPVEAMQRVYDLLGITREDVLFVNAAVPCRSFSIASHSGHGRAIASDPGGHGCNFRKADQFRTPCCDRKHCKYGIVARQHDMLARGVQEVFEHEKILDSDFQWGIENPTYGDLPRRDYMQPEQ